MDAFFDSLRWEQGNRLVVFIDELYSCKPSYAVKLFEIVKHYFSNERITFVFATNIGELQYTIRHFYGNDFDACKYLDGFFDLRIFLPPADMTNYYRETGLSTSPWCYEKVVSAVIKMHTMLCLMISKAIQSLKST